MWFIINKNENAKIAVSSCCLVRDETRKADPSPSPVSVCVLLKSPCERCFCSGFCSSTATGAIVHNRRLLSQSACSETAAHARTRIRIRIRKALGRSTCPACVCCAGSHRETHLNNIRPVTIISFFKCFTWKRIIK